MIAYGILVYKYKQTKYTFTFWLLLLQILKRLFGIVKLLSIIVESTEQKFKTNV